MFNLVLIKNIYKKINRIIEFNHGIIKKTLIFTWKYYLSGGIEAYTYRGIVNIIGLLMIYLHLYIGKSKLFS